MGKNNNAILQLVALKTVWLALSNQKYSTAYQKVKHLENGVLDKFAAL